MWRSAIPSCLVETPPEGLTTAGSRHLILSYHAEAEELRSDGENVFAVIHVSGRGRGSGIEIDDRAYIHFKVRDGRIVYCYEYADKAEALEAAGLHE